MTVLVDANLLLRRVQPGHPMHQSTMDAVATLRAQGNDLCVVPRVLYEFWVGCTRPVGVNGLGKTAAEAAVELRTLKSDFIVLDDTPAILPEWERLVTTHAVLGKNAHDARLVAAMLVHGVTHLLTFNDQNFRRFTVVTVLTPAAVLAPPSPPTP